MSLHFAALGTVIGTIIYALAAQQLFMSSIGVVMISVLAFTTMRKYHIQIISCLFFVLLSYFNYHLRADYMEIRETKNLISTESKFEIINQPLIDAYYNSKFILELKSSNPLKDFVIPLRLVAKSNSSKGFEKGDIVKLNNENYKVEKLNKSKLKYYKKEKVFAQLKTKSLVFVEHQENPIEKIQKAIKSYFEQSMSKNNASITSALLMGTRVAKAPQEFLGKVRALGLGHFFAASGFHLMLLCLLLTWLLGKTPLNKNSVALLSLLACFSYAALAGFSPSIIRAGIFVSAYLIANLFQRKLFSIKFITILAGMVLFIDPYTIFDIGFQLSYLATLAILIWATPIKEKLSSIIANQFFLELVSVTLAVQIFLLPVVLYYFKTLQIWTVVANIIFAPLLSLVVLLSFMGLSFLVEPLLNLFKTFLDYSQLLPFINSQTEISGNSFVLLFLLMNLIAINIFLVEHPKLPKIFSSKKIRYATTASLMIFLAAAEAPVPGLKSIDISYGRFEGQSAKAIKQALKKPYAYTEIAGLKTLVIKAERNLDLLSRIPLKEVHLLILPEISASDIYLNTLLKITKAQFVICNISRDSKKAQKNIDIIRANANTIVNSGKLYISKQKYWSLGTYE